MSKEINQEKYCNCLVSCNKEILKSNINHSYCNKCGSVLLKDKFGKIYYTLKSKQKIQEIEFNPIDIIRAMKKRTDVEYPYLNKEYNIDDKNDNLKDKKMKSIKLYLKYRKMIIVTLQKYIKMLDYTDSAFYHCLFYTDIIFSHNMSEDISEKIILYYLVGYFLFSSKMEEIDPDVPSLNIFCYPYKKIYLSVKNIYFYEILCLKSIKYNPFIYSAYDWINELISIGIVFNCEIDKNNSIILINGHRHSIINVINKNIMRMLLIITVKNIFLKFSPMYIAFSLIQLSREEYLDKNIINSELFNKLIELYGISFNDYKQCYEEIKEEFEIKKNESSENKEQEESNENIEQENSNDNIEQEKSNENIEQDKSNENIEKEEKEKNMDDEENKENIEYDINDKNNPINNDDKKSQNDDDEIENKMSEEIIDFPSRVVNTENNIIGEKQKVENNDEFKEENIIFYDKNDEEKNTDLTIDSSMTFNKIKDIQKNDSKFKLKSSIDLNLIKIKDKSKLYINCNNIDYKSENNLPKINTSQRAYQQTFNHSSRKINKKNGNLYNLKNSLFRDSFNSIYSRTNHKDIYPIKIQKVPNSTKNKRYYQTENSNKNISIYKEKLNSMRKSLFYEKINNNKNNIETISNKRLKKTSLEVPPSIIKLTTLFKDNINNEVFNEKNNNHEEENRRYKSKGKYRNIPIGKEIKAYMLYKRHLSTDFKKRLFKSVINANNNISNTKIIK